MTYNFSVNFFPFPKCLKRGWVDVCCKEISQNRNVKNTVFLFNLFENLHELPKKEKRKHTK
jgi:hypothetical protein